MRRVSTGGSRLIDVESCVQGLDAYTFLSWIDEHITTRNRKSAAGNVTISMNEEDENYAIINRHHDDEKEEEITDNSNHEIDDKSLATQSISPPITVAVYQEASTQPHQYSQGTTTLSIAPSNTINTEKLNNHPLVNTAHRPPTNAINKNQCVLTTWSNKKNNVETFAWKNINPEELELTRASSSNSITHHIEEQPTFTSNHSNSNTNNNTPVMVTKKDSEAIFGEMVAEELRQFTGRKRAIIRHRIQTLLFEEKMKYFDENDGDDGNTAVSSPPNKIQRNGISSS
ncbi:MAG: hypothetical protein AAFY76_22205 [Cyanobacteria bacterium J06649_11]